MRCLTVSLLLTLFFIIPAAYAQPTLIGTAATNDYANGAAVDNAGNTYTAGTMNNRPWVFKSDPAGNMIWSVLLGAPAEHGDISFIQMVGDTLFGCGWRKSGATILGGIYFKMNAATGAVYWIRSEATSESYFSSMRYANGRYYLAGAQANGATGYNAKVWAVSSATGVSIWQTPAFALEFPPNTADHIDDITCSTEMINGKMYMTGRSYVNGASSLNMRITLVGINDNGTIFLNKYLLFDISSPQVSRYYGQGIQYDGADSLVIAMIGDDFCTGCTDYKSGIVKTDLNGNVGWAKTYDLQGVTFEVSHGLTVTDDSYVMYGYAGSSNTRVFVIKTTKYGVFQEARLITANASGNATPVNTVLNAGGMPGYANGKHHFPAGYYTTNANLRDIMPIVLDENLNNPQSCLVLTPTPVVTSPITPFSGNLARFDFPNTVTNQPVPDVTTYAVANPCNVQVNYQQSNTCSSQTFTASVTGVPAAQFSWSNGASGATATVTTTDTLFLNITAIPGCCLVRDTIIPSFATVQPVTVTLPADTSLCLVSGTSFTLTPTLTNAVGTVGYTWNTGETTASITAGTSGTWWVEVEDDCGTAADTIVIAMNFFPEVDGISPVNVCTDDFPVSLEPDVINAASVSWNDGVLTTDRTVNVPGAYTITATNSCGSDAFTYTVTEIPLPDVQLPATIDTCIWTAGTLILTPVATNVSGFSWSDGSTDPQLGTNVSGNWWVAGINQCGSDTAWCDIAIGFFPEVDGITPINACADEFPVLLEPDVTNAASVSWNDGVLTTDRSVIDPGTYTITATNGCGSAAFTYTVHEMPLPDVQLPAAIDTCVATGTTVVLMPAVADAFSFSWSDGSTNQQLGTTVSGNFWVAGINQCGSDTAWCNVTIGHAPEVSGDSPVAACADDFPVSLEPDTTNAVSVSWNDGVLTVDRIVAGPGVYTITATNSCGSDAFTYTVSEIPLPDVQLPSVIDTCVTAGAGITLAPTSLSNVNALSWSDGTAGSQVSVTATGNWWVAGINQCGSDTAWCAITINNFPELYLPSVLDTCFDAISGIDYTASGSAGTYVWNTGATQPTVHITAEGPYTCTLTNNCGSVSGTMIVTFLGAVDLLIPGDTLSLCADDIPQSFLQIETNYELSLSDNQGALGPGEHISASGWIYVEAYNMCESLMDSVYVELRGDELFYLPNAFTPDENMINELYTYKGTYVTVLKTEIFNRWGERIFVQEGDFTGWDGTYKGQECPDGIYQVQIVYADCFGISKQFNGHVNLLR